MIAPSRPRFLGLATLALALLLAIPAIAHEPLNETLAVLAHRIAADPGNARLYLERAEYRRLAGTFEDAEDDLLRAARLDPTLAGVAAVRAQLELDRGNVRAALKALDAMPAEQAAQGTILRMRARTMQGLGRNPEAVAAWDAAIAALDPPQPDDYIERARLMNALDDEAGARIGLEQGIARLGPGLSLVHALRVLGADRSRVSEEDEEAEEEAEEELESRNGLPVAPPPGSEPDAAALPALDATLTRGPWLQVARPTGMSIRWRTNTGTNSRVNWGTAPGVTLGTVDDATLVTQHELVINGLTPDTRYYYTVGSTTETLAGGDTCSFVTSPPTGLNRDTRIWAVGDSGLPGAAQNRVRDAFMNWTGARGADLWLMLGDNAYNSGTDAEYTNGVFVPYAKQLRKWCLWPTRGNHDGLLTGSNNDYYDFFTMPTAAQAGGQASLTEAYYSFDYGNIHFICLDSEGTARTPGSSMLTWLAGDLAANPLPWTIAFWHHPPYTKGSHDSDNAADSGGRMRDMRQYALPILEAGGVDLVLTGHSHSYERSFMIDGHYGVSSTLVPAMILDSGDGSVDGDGAYHKPTAAAVGHEGAVYAVGGSSAQTSGGPLNHPAMVHSFNVLGSLVIDVSGTRLDLRFLDDVGVVRDRFAITKGSGSAAVEVEERGGLELGPALPNPFRNEMTIDFTLPAAAHVRLDVFDAAGRRVATLANGDYPAGTHMARWDGRDGRRLMPAGVYLASLESQGRRTLRRIAFVR